MTSGVADVYLQKESSEVEKTIAQRNVVMTQPNRKGTGDWGQYTSAERSRGLKEPAGLKRGKGSTEGTDDRLHARR